MKILSNFLAAALVFLIAAPVRAHECPPCAAAAPAQPKVKKVRKVAPPPALAPAPEPLPVCTPAPAPVPSAPPPPVTPPPPPPHPPTVVLVQEACSYSGICCRMEGFIPVPSCGFHWSCPGKQEVRIVDGVIASRGECK